jgi:mercuric ion binding protein
LLWSGWAARHFLGRSAGRAHADVVPPVCAALLLSTVMKKLIALLVATALTASTALAEGLRTVTLDVTKMDCAVCPITVRKALEKVTGVAWANVDFSTKRAAVVFDPTKASVNALTKANAGAGYPSYVREMLQ